MARKSSPQPPNNLPRTQGRGTATDSPQLADEIMAGRARGRKIMKIQASAQSLNAC